MRIQHNFVYQVVRLNLSAFSPLCSGAWQRQVSFERMPVAKCLCWLEGGRKKYENNHGNRIEAVKEGKKKTLLPSYSLASFRARQFPIRVNFLFFKLLLQHHAIQQTCSRYFRKVSRFFEKIPRYRYFSDTQKYLDLDTFKILSEKVSIQCTVSCIQIQILEQVCCLVMLKAILFCKQKPLLRWLFAVHFSSLSLFSSLLQ